jgi:hypothetical protein
MSIGEDCRQYEVNSLLLSYNHIAYLLTYLSNLATENGQVGSFNCVLFHNLLLHL